MQNNDYVSFEYKTVLVKAGNQTKAMDMYEAFGWEITSTSPSVNGVVLSLKRDRRLKHKQELVKLERQAENVAGEIDSLERSKTLGASVFGYIFGTASALVLGGGMSLVMLAESSIPAIVGGSFLGVVGLILCGVTYPIYKRIAAKKTKQVLPVIDETEEKLANIQEKGNELLSADII